MEINYRDHYEPAPTDVLLRVYIDLSGKYANEVYTTIETILEERNVKFKKIDIASRGLQQNTVLEKKADYIPLILGVASILVAFATTKYPLDPLSGIVITVFSRLVFLFYTVSLCNQYGLNKIVWIAIVLFFGGWGMIALSLVTFAKVIKTSNQLNIDREAEAVSLKEAHVDVQDENGNIHYTVCPACFTNLMEEKKCKGCGLEFD